MINKLWRANARWSSTRSKIKAGLLKKEFSTGYRSRAISPDLWSGPVGQAVMELHRRVKGEWGKGKRKTIFEKHYSKYEIGRRRAVWMEVIPPKESDTGWAHSSASGHMLALSQEEWCLQWNLHKRDYAVARPCSLVPGPGFGYEHICVYLETPLRLEVQETVTQVDLGERGSIGDSKPSQMPLLRT